MRSRKGPRLRGTSHLFGGVQAHVRTRPFACAACGEVPPCVGVERHRSAADAGHRRTWANSRGRRAFAACADPQRHWRVHLHRRRSFLDRRSQGLRIGAVTVALSVAVLDAMWNRHALRVAGDARIGFCIWLSATLAVHETGGDSHRGRLSGFWALIQLPRGWAAALARCEPILGTEHPRGTRRSSSVANAAGKSRVCNTCSPSRAISAARMPKAYLEDVPMKIATSSAQGIGSQRRGRGRLRAVRVDTQATPDDPYGAAAWAHRIRTDRSPLVKHRMGAGLW